MLAINCKRLYMCLHDPAQMRAACLRSAAVLCIVLASGSALLIGAEPGDVPFSMLGRYELPCPVCRQVFQAVSCPQSNTRGGVDRDLFARALGPQPEFYRIATCPKCGYSGYASDFGPDAALSPEFIERVLQPPGLDLPAGFTPESDPRDLDAADRYALAATCYRWRGKPDEALAWLHLRASWVAREEGAILPPDDRLERVFRFIERWRPALGPGDNQADAELRTATRAAEAVALGRFNRYQRPYVELSLGLILRRHGENRQAGPLIDRLAGHAGFAQPLREGIARMQASIAAERRQQVAAAECFERALMAHQIAEANRGAAAYLLGELFRRLGRDRDAIRWYEQALGDRKLPADLRRWARQQREWIEASGGE